MSFTYARTFRLTFEMPRPDSEVTIRAQIHHVTENEGLAEFISGTQEELFRRLSAIAIDSVKFSDPISGQQYEASVAAIANAVTQIVRAWFPQEFEGEFNSDNKYVVSREE